MNLNIVSFIKGLLPSFKKSDIVDDFETSMEYIKETSIPSYASLSSLYVNDFFNSKEAKDVIAEFYKNLDFGKSSVKLTKKNFAKDVHELLTNSLVNAKFLYDEIDRTVNDAVVSHSLTIYNSVILRSVAHYSFMSKYSTDLLNYLYHVEMQNSNKDLDNTSPNKAQIKAVLDNVWIFAKLISFYGVGSDDFKDKLSNIPNMTVDKDKIEDNVDLYNAASIEPLAAVPYNFSGSPIYSIRLMFAQWEADRYKELKDKKKLLELRHLYLQMQKEKGQGDIAMEKEIAYLQKRITDIDYKITKIERSLDD